MSACRAASRAINCPQMTGHSYSKRLDGKNLILYGMCILNSVPFPPLIFCSNFCPTAFTEFSLRTYWFSSLCHTTARVIYLRCLGRGFYQERSVTSGFCLVACGPAPPFTFLTDLPPWRKSGVSLERGAFLSWPAFLRTTAKPVPASGAGGPLKCPIRILGDCSPVSPRHWLSLSSH